LSELRCERGADGPPIASPQYMQKKASDHTIAGFLAGVKRVA